MSPPKPDASLEASVKFLARRFAPSSETCTNNDQSNFPVHSDNGTSHVPETSDPTDRHGELSFAYHNGHYQPLCDPRFDQDTHMPDRPWERSGSNRDTAKKRAGQDSTLRDKPRLQNLHRTTGGVGKNTNRRFKNSKGIPSSAVQKALASPIKSAVSEPASREWPIKRDPNWRDDASDASGISSISSGALSDLSAAPEPSETTAESDGAEVEVLLQPQTKPINSDQLLVEVQAIYEGLGKLEAQAIEVDHAQSQAAQVDPSHRRPLSKTEYQSLIALHKALIHEHHDLCLATQHPAATPRLRQLPAKYSTPARMWRHAVHSLLEIFRMRLPEAREHMIAFVLISFNHLTLFLETVPQFEATWLECIGDLGRYRLALADNDEEREIFSRIARDWYCRAIQINPHISRLYHHCAILAPPFSLEQLSLYGRSLTGIIPFIPARKSILALFRPVVSGDETLARQLSPTTLTILRAHATMAIGGRGSRARFNHCLSQLQNGVFERLWAEASQRQVDKKKLGAHLAIANSALILQYGTTRGNGTSGSMVRIFLDASGSAASGSNGMFSLARPGMTQSGLYSSFDALELAHSKATIKAACSLTFGIFAEALRKPKDEDLHPMVHVCFIMIWSLSRASKAVHEVMTQIPWRDMARFLNTYANAASMSGDICSAEFPASAGGRDHPLPEDFLLKGLIFARGYFPNGWTEDCCLDSSEQGIEKPFMTATRIQRMLWAGHKIAQQQKYLFYDESSRRFEAGFGMEGLELGADDTEFVSLLPDADFVQ